MLGAEPGGTIPILWVERTVRRLMHENLFEKASGFVLARTIRVNEEVVVTTTEVFVTGMNPHCLDADTLSSWQLADHWCKTLCFSLSSANTPKLGIDFDLDRKAIVVACVEKVGIDSDKAVDPTVEHQPRAPPSVHELLERGRV